MGSAVGDEEARKKSTGKQKREEESDGNEKNGEKKGKEKKERNKGEKKDPVNMKVTLNIAEPLVCVCTAPSVDDVREAASQIDKRLPHQQQPQQQQQQLKQPQKRQQSQQQPQHQKQLQQQQQPQQQQQQPLAGTDSNESVVVMKPSIKNMLTKCHEDEPDLDICIKAWENIYPYINQSINLSIYQLINE